MNRLPEESDNGVSRAPRPEKTGPDFYFMRLKGSEGYTFTCFSSAVWGFNVHWNGKLSEPHYTNSKKCPGCHKELPLRWKGFLFVHVMEKKRNVFLELTPASAEQLEQQVAMGENYRGMTFYAKRTKADNGRMLIRVLSERRDPATLPKDVDPYPSLMRMWGIKPGAPEGGKEFPTSANGFFAPQNGECL